MFRFTPHKSSGQTRSQIAVTFMLLAMVAWGWQSTEAQEGIDLTIQNVSDENFPAISFELTPVNIAGVPFTDLTESALSVLDESGELPIVSFDRGPDADEPISLMIAIDASGSMQQSGQLADVREQVIAFRETLSPFDEVGILFFGLESDGIGVEVYPAADPREFAPSMDGGGSINFMNRFAPNDPDAGAPLYDALFRSIEVLAAEADYDRRAVIVLTDGVDSARENGEKVEVGSTRADADIVIGKAKELGIPMFMLGLSGGEPADSDEWLDAIDAIELTKLATESGGNEILFVSSSGVSSMLSGVANQLKTKYSVTTQAQIEPDNGLHPLTINVKTNRGEAVLIHEIVAFYPVKPDLQLTYRDNEQTSMVSETLADGVSGTLVFEPLILARNPISKVDYFIDDNLVYTSMANPFDFELDTTSLLESAVTMTKLKVVVTDNQNPANVSEIEQSLWIQPCSLTCLAAENNFTTLDTTTFMAILSALAVLVVLLIFFVIFTILRNRRQPQAELFANQTFQPVPVNVESNPAGYVSPSQNPAKPVLMTEPNVLNDTIVDQPLTIADSEMPDNSATIVDVEPSIPKTEVLDRPSSRLVYLFSQESGQQHALNGGRITIGRTPENQICIADTAISSQHAIIQIENDQFALYDAGASNPIFVNDQPLENGQLLKDGDRLQLGRQIWVFKDISS
ncbi:MAG: FHA domain-containing protein [Chloroflexota bacterium]